MKKRKLLQKILNNPKNVRFSDARLIIEAFGFRLSRVVGGHHIFLHPNVNEIVNLQNANGQAKPYQIKQFLQLIERHNLEMEDR